MNSKKILIDTDNTLGQSFRWNDDGLAILYCFGKQDFDIIGITTVFGNSSVKSVYRNTNHLLQAIGNSDIPVIKGASEKGDTETDASEYLAEMASSHLGEISLLAFGPLTNLHGAYKKSPEFFKNLREIILMGGITKERLEVGRIKMKDVNLRHDLPAALSILSAECPITVINCHICKQVPLRKKHLQEIQFFPDGIQEEIKEEFWINKKVQKLDHIFIWDVLVPVYLANPEFFEENEVKIRAESTADIKDGRLLKADKNGIQINMPTKLLDPDRFYREIFKAWNHLNETVMDKQGSYIDLNNNRVKRAIFKGTFCLLIPIALRLMYKKRDGFYYEK